MSGIGNLRERIVIQSASIGVSSGGEPIETWSDLVTVWARCKFLSGLESVDTHKTDSHLVAVFTVRYRTDITELMRISWRSEVWNIHAVLPDERKAYTELTISKVE